MPGEGSSRFVEVCRQSSQWGLGVRAATIVASLLCWPACGPNDPGNGDADADIDADGDGDGDLCTDADGDDENDAEATIDGDIDDEASFTGEITARDGSTGSVVLLLTPVGPECGEPIRFELTTGVFRIPELPDGRYGLHAWIDEDGDGLWDGIWEGSGEPAARMGIVLPRHDFQLLLRRGVPEPILDGDPHWVDLYHHAWELAEGHIAAGTPENGFADHYMDEAFSEQIFQWDTCFMTLFGRFGLDAFPVMPSLDNFYGAQSDDGFICRVVNESDGGACEPGEDPNINPPLFGWVELLYAQQTGDLSRVPCVISNLERYHDWIDANVRTGPGLYYTSMLGSGMDNAPRDAAYDGWVDITAQQALGRRVLARLAELIGASVAAHEAEAERICDDVRRLTWNSDEGFFFDLGWEGVFLPDKTLAGIWPLVAGCATTEQAREVIDHLQDPAEFWRVHVFPSTSADSSAYDSSGYYWRGGVWAPTTYASTVALSLHGRDDVARRAAENHIRALDRVYREFVPDPGQLSAEARGDGRNTLWELYAPDSYSPGTRWDASLLGRQDFVGWTGLGPIAMLLEHVVGLHPEAVEDRLTWQLGRTDRHGVLGYRFGDQIVDLTAASRDLPSSPITIDVVSSDSFELVVVVGGRRWSFDVPAGETSLEVDPGDAPLSPGTVPAGPYPGHAVLGNGRISAVVADDPAELIHLYDETFGLDLVESARPIVVREGREAAPTKVGLDPFFAAYGEVPLAERGQLAWRTFVGAEDAVVWQGALTRGDDDGLITIVPFLRLRAAPHIDGEIEVSTIAHESERLVVSYTDGRTLAIGSSPTPAAVQAGEIDHEEILSHLSGEIGSGNELALEIPLAGAPGETVLFRWAIALGDDSSSALSALDEVLGGADPLDEASEHWAGWSPETLCASDGPRCRVAAANLYAARASSLDGRVPADLTGQFVTNGFPQLYPRDALMVARAFTLAGHPVEAWEIVHDWLGTDRARPSAGEWYARYDALGRAVDGGSGARYDVPEWDSNGYLAVLVEELGPESLSSSEREALLLALDFIAANQDDDGLYTEGGIVEWTGRLPATAMTNWAGLDAGARLARGWDEVDREAEYLAAAGRIRGGLLQLFDLERQILADEREGSLMYDSSLLFGPAWGYPADPLLDRTFEWLVENASSHGGGIRYFWGNDYGQDLFFFTTSATTQYAATTGRLDTANALLGWMLTQTNRYGLSPERVYQDGGGAAEATPLSWCAAELAVAVMTLREAEIRGSTPVLDGVLTAAEYRAGGFAVVDADGEPDRPGDGIALYAVHDDDELHLGLQLAGEIDAFDPDAVYYFYLAPHDGRGTHGEGEGGERLTFRADPTVSPGAAARVALTPSTGACLAGAATAAGYEDMECESAAGSRAIEIRVALPALGIEGAVQLIAVTGNPDGSAVLPSYGSMLLGDDESSVLVTFEVDASAVAGSLDPESGIIVTLSGDRAELGGWRGHAIGLRDDGVLGDEAAGDNLWTVVVRLPDRGRIEHKFLIGPIDDETWAGAELDGANRSAWIQDPNDTGRVRLRHTFGVRGITVLDP